LEPKKKIHNHFLDHQEEIKKCKEDPIYFYEKYWLPYALGVNNTYVRDVEKFLLEMYWETSRNDLNN
jgi:hypothetical protein